MPAIRTPRTRARAASSTAASSSRSPQHPEQALEDDREEDEAEDDQDDAGNVKGEGVRADFNQKVYRKVREIPEGKVRLLFLFRLFSLYCPSPMY